jgi:flagellar export protein FliJ
MAAFRLQRVLDYRKQREDELRQRLAIATQARVRAEEALTRLLAEEQQRREDLSAMLNGGHIDAGRVQELGRMLNLYPQAIAAQRQEIARRAAFEAEERTRLQTASVERKGLDRPREQHEQRERVESNRREALLIDDIVTARAARQRLAGGAAAFGGN